MKSELPELRERRHREARAWKERTGGKVVGLFCCSVPEELIHAAGMLPVTDLVSKGGGTATDDAVPGHRREPK